MENIAMWQIFQCWKSIFANSSILSSWKQLFCCCCCWRATLVSLRSDWHCHCESSQQMCYPSVSWISNLFKLDNFKIDSILIKDHKSRAISSIFFFHLEGSGIEKESLLWWKCSTVKIAIIKTKPPLSVSLSLLSKSAPFVISELSSDNFGSQRLPR